MSKTRKFTVNEIRKLLQEYENRKIQVNYLASRLSQFTELKRSFGYKDASARTHPEDFFSWIEGLSKDNITAILEEKSHE